MQFLWIFCALTLTSYFFLMLLALAYLNSQTLTPSCLHIYKQQVTGTKTKNWLQRERTNGLIDDVTMELLIAAKI